MLITGGGGYVGLKLSQELTRRGYKVTALDVKFLSDEALAREKDEFTDQVEVYPILLVRPQYYRALQANITDAGRINEVVSSCRPHGIFHVASYGMSGREMVH